MAGLLFFLTVQNALNWIWDRIKGASDKLLTITIAIADFMKKSFDWFLSTAPSWLKRLLFFFIIIVLANAIVGFFVSLNYTCLSDGTLRSPNTFVGGIGLYLSGTLEGFANSTIDYDEYVLQRTVEVPQYDESDPRGIFYVRCFGNSPKFTLNGLDFLNWQYWTIIIILMMLYKVGKDFNIL